jgi:hypothetical protein
LVYARFDSPYELAPQSVSVSILLAFDRLLSAAVDGWLSIARLVVIVTQN